MGIKHFLLLGSFAFAFNSYSVHATEQDTRSTIREHLEIIESFVKAAAEGDINSLEQLSKHRSFNVNYIASSGKTALIAAVEASQLEAVKYLLLNFADLDVHRATGNTSIMMRAVNAEKFSTNDSLEIFRLLEQDPRTSLPRVPRTLPPISRSTPWARVHELPDYVDIPDPEKWHH